MISSFFPISSANAPISLVRAKNLALSKFICFPLITSASNSAASELSISNNPSAIPSNCFNSNPNCLALNESAANSSTWPAKVAKVPLDIFCISFNKVFSFIAKSFWMFNALTWPKNSVVIPLEDAPVASDNLLISLAASVL